MSLAIADSKSTTFFGISLRPSVPLGMSEVGFRCWPTLESDFSRRVAPLQNAERICGHRVKAQSGTMLFIAHLLLKIVNLVNSVAFHDACELICKYDKKCRMGRVYIYLIISQLPNLELPCLTQSGNADDLDARLLINSR
jgi:hypothetical protein